MTAWIVRFDPPEPTNRGGGLRVAVKDAIDIAGVVTTAGCPAVRDTATPASADAACLAGVRAGAIIAGKTTLTELCLDPTGVNEAFGTPVNPLAPDRIPGGSSSGSAVVVAGHEADLALGTDTGGSVRVPAACCGIAGLKTTRGRVPTAGVWPLAPSLDTVGPLARDVSGIVAAMRLLEPGWRCDRTSARVVGRLRVEGVDPAVEGAVDAALALAGLTTHDVRLAGWDGSFGTFRTILLSEFWRAHRTLLDADGLGHRADAALHKGREIDTGRLRQALAARGAWQEEVARAMAGVDLLALPTLVAPPPLLAKAGSFPAVALTAPFNLAGVPALAMPVPAPGLPVPASLQLVGPPGAEDLLCATGLAIEATARARASKVGSSPVAGRMTHRSPWMPSPNP
jgi:amidase